MFQLQGAAISYQATPVLEDINLTIATGEKVVLIGPSGVGKTTLLSRLYELESDRSAFIHQDYALVPQLSVFHNVFIGALDRHPVWYSLLNLIKARADDVSEVKLILSQLGMEDKTFERVAQLSGGQRQRVAVARALFRHSDILLADEPVSAIDPLQAGSVLRLLRAGKRTVIVSMHHFELALEHFDRVVGLQKGRVLFDLPREDVDPALIAQLYNRC